MVYSNWNFNSSYFSFNIYYIIYANFKKNFFSILVIICFVALFAAFFIEYFLGHQPCNLCLIRENSLCINYFNSLIYLQI